MLIQLIIKVSHARCICCGNKMSDVSKYYNYLFMKNMWDFSKTIVF